MPKLYIKKNEEWDEYRVHVVGRPDLIYYAADHQDAIDTMAAMDAEINGQRVKRYSGGILSKLEDDIITLEGLPAGADIAETARALGNPADWSLNRGEALKLYRDTLDAFEAQLEPVPTETRDLTFYTDPGHGWLKVRVADVKALGLKVTEYSYVSPKGSYLYLEEDCDAPRFSNAAKKAGWKLNITQKNSNRDSFIRRYRRTVG